MIASLQVLLLATTLTAPPPCPATVRELRVQTPAGHVLAARLSLPARTKRAPVVVMISGAGPYDREYSTAGVGAYGDHFFAAVESRLLCASIGALRFDEVGTGRSTGSYADYATTMTLADDVIAIVEALCEQPGVDSARVALLGHSEGGAIAAVVAARRPTVAAAIFLAAPVERGDDIMRFQIARDERESAAAGEEARREHARRSASDRWYQFFLGFDPAPFYARLRQPMLVLHGDYDDSVTPAQADSIVRLARADGNRFVYCRRYAEHGHGFYANGTPGDQPTIAAPEVVADIVRYARLTLRESRPPTSPGESCRREGAGAFSMSPEGSTRAR